MDDNIAESSRPGTVYPSEQDNASNDDLINNKGNTVDSPNFKGAGSTIEMGPKMQTGKGAGSTIEMGPKMQTGKKAGSTIEMGPKMQTDKKAGQPL